MMYDVPTLQNMGLLDVNFPYPLAFCTAFNLGITIFTVIVFIALMIAIYKIVKWFYKLL